MPSTHLTKRIRVSADDLLEMVTDVERYPEFIPFFTALRIKSRQNILDDHERLIADARVGYKFLSETFSSEVNIHHADRKLHITKAGRGGAVSSLVNDWQFIALSDGSCLVDFEIDVKLKAFPLEMLAREKFGRASEFVMEIMEKRALSLYPAVGDERPSASLEVEMASYGLQIIT